MNIFRFGDFGQTFLGFISCICWINDVNSLIDSGPTNYCPGLPVTARGLPGVVNLLPGVVNLLPGINDITVECH